MNIALLLSGGAGTRIGGDIPKQYRKAGGRLVISYCMETLLAHPDIDALQIVAEPKWQQELIQCGERLVGTGRWEQKFQGFSLPGANRQMSIFHGLEAIWSYGGDGDYVLIHDGARPLLSAGQITDCLKGAAGHDGAMPVLPMKDTVYYSAGGQYVERLLERSAVYAGQAPEVFEVGKYYEANCGLMPDKILHVNGSTEPAVMAGMDIVMIPGDEGNFKITTKGDLERFCRMVEESQGKEGGDDR